MGPHGCQSGRHPEYLNSDDMYHLNQCHRWARAVDCRPLPGKTCTRLHIPREEFQAKLRATESEMRCFNAVGVQSEPPEADPALSQICEDLATGLLAIKDLPREECMHALSHALAAAAASLRTASQGSDWRAGF
jgi:hypothetical protein